VDGLTTVILHDICPKMPEFYIIIVRKYFASRILYVYAIGADSMGAIAPTAKQLWGRCPQVVPIGTVLLLFSNCKMYS